MPKFRALLTSVGFLLVSWNLCAFAQETPSANSLANFRMTGGMELLSDYIEHGLTQTERSPALQGNFWLNFGPQMRIGLMGSNTSYSDSNDHLLLKPSADIKINFSNNANFVIYYNLNRYFSSADRNGDTVGGLLTFYGYRFRYEMNSNWEGTHTRSNYISLGKTFDVFGDWKWDNEGGYSMLKADGFGNYFDFSSFLGYQLGRVFLKGGVTATSTTKQFDGAGGYFLVVGASTEF